MRVPLNYHALSTAPGVYVEAGFERVDDFVAWCKASGIYVILDLHAAPGAQNCEEMGDTPDGVAHLWKEPASYRQWTIDLWQTIARRYAGETAIGGYDVFDEPYDGVVYASIAALGFCVLENALMLRAHPEGGWWYARALRLCTERAVLCRARLAADLVLAIGKETGADGRGAGAPCQAGAALNDVRGLAADNRPEDHRCARFSLRSCRRFCRGNCRSCRHLTRGQRLDCSFGKFDSEIAHI